LECRRLRAHDRGAGIAERLVAAPLSTVASNGEQNIHVAANQIVHSGRHIDRTTRSTEDCAAVLMNGVNISRREHDRFRPSDRIKTLITAPKAQDLSHPVGMMEFEE